MPLYNTSMARPAGLEPATNRLTAERSTIELWANYILPYTSL